MAPAGLREATFRCLGQSDRHLFAGTTGASVMVFSKQNECDRTDIHLCHMPNADKTYCLQSTLKLPKVRNGHGGHREHVCCARGGGQGHQEGGPCIHATPRPALPQTSESAPRIHVQCVYVTTPPPPPSL